MSIKSERDDAEREWRKEYGSRLLHGWKYSKNSKYAWGIVRNRLERAKQSGA
jgi:hypothetical protein